MTEKNIYNQLKQLGAKTQLPESPEKAILESVENPQTDVDCVVRFTASENVGWCSLSTYKPHV